MEPTHWTPTQGPARNQLERIIHHVFRNRIAWYISAVTTLCCALQLGVGGR